MRIGLVAESIVRVVERFLVLIIHVHHAAHTPVRVGPDPVTVFLEVFRCCVQRSGRIPGFFQILDNIIAISGIKMYLSKIMTVFYEISIRSLTKRVPK